MEKAERGQLFSRERVLRIGWTMKLFVGVADFFAKLLFSHRGSPSWWRHSQTGTDAGALRGSSYTLASVSNQPLLSAGSPFSPTTQKQPRPHSPSNRNCLSDQDFPATSCCCWCNLNVDQKKVTKGADIHSPCFLNLERILHRGKLSISYKTNYFFPKHLNA